MPCAPWSVSIPQAETSPDSARAGRLARTKCSPAHWALPQREWNIMFRQSNSKTSREAHDQTSTLSIQKSVRSERHNIHLESPVGQLMEIILGPHFSPSWMDLPTTRSLFCNELSLKCSVSGVDESTPWRRRACWGRDGTDFGCSYGIEEPSPARNQQQTDCCFLIVLKGGYVLVNNHWLFSQGEPDSRSPETPRWFMFSGCI